MFYNAQSSATSVLPSVPLYPLTLIPSVPPNLLPSSSPPLSRPESSRKITLAISALSFLFLFSFIQKHRNRAGNPSPKTTGFRLVLGKAVLPKTNGFSWGATVYLTCQQYRDTSFYFLFSHEHQLDWFVFKDLGPESEGEEEGKLGKLPCCQLLAPKVASNTHIIIHLNLVRIRKPVTKTQSPAALSSTGARKHMRPGVQQRAHLNEVQVSC